MGKVGDLQEASTDVRCWLSNADSMNAAKSGQVLSAATARSGSMASNPKNYKPKGDRQNIEHYDSCSCKFNPPGTSYYVSVVDGPRFGLLAGPFRTHVEALERVDRAREEAYRVDPWSVFYAFGTTAMKPEYRKPGSLNELLGLNQAEP